VLILTETSNQRCLRLGEVDNYCFNDLCAFPIAGAILSCGDAGKQCGKKDAKVQESGDGCADRHVAFE